MYYRVSFYFLFDFLSSFFNLLFYSYATCVQNLKRLRRVVVEICDSKIYIIYDVPTLSINFVIFIQAAAICKTGPSSSQHVAVLVPAPAINIFK